MVEETTAAAHSLDNETTRLKALVAGFQLGEPDFEAAAA
jgi:hypothetical protein